MPEDFPIDHDILPGTLASYIAEMASALGASYGTPSARPLPVEDELILASQVQHGIAQQERMAAMLASGEAAQRDERGRVEPTAIYLALSTHVIRARRAEHKLMGPQLALCARLAACASARAGSADVLSDYTLEDTATIDFRAQVAVVGLLRAIRAFTPEMANCDKPIRLAGFATPIIQAELRRYAAYDLELPDGPTGVSAREHYVAGLLEAVYGLVPGSSRRPFGTVAKRAIAQLFAADAAGSHQTVSLDTLQASGVPEKELDQLWIAEPVSAEHNASEDLLAHHIQIASRQLLERALRELPAQESDVVRRRHGLVDGISRTPDEIAAEYRVNAVAVERLLERAYRTMRDGRYGIGLRKLLPL